MSTYPRNLGEFIDAALERMDLRREPKKRRARLHGILNDGEPLPCPTGFDGVPAYGGISRAGYVPRPKEELCSESSPSPECS